jgi:hypothetical protein
MPTPPPRRVVSVRSDTAGLLYSLPSFVNVPCLKVALNSTVGPTRAFHGPCLNLSVKALILSFIRYLPLKACLYPPLISATTCKDLIQP